MFIMLKFFSLVLFGQVPPLKTSLWTSSTPSTDTTTDPFPTRSVLLSVPPTPPVPHKRWVLVSLGSVPPLSTQSLHYQVWHVEWLANQKKTLLDRWPLKVSSKTHGALLFNFLPVPSSSLFCVLRFCRWVHTGLPDVVPLSSLYHQPQSKTTIKLPSRVPLKNIQPMFHPLFLSSVSIVGPNPGVDNLLTSTVIDSTHFASDSPHPNPWAHLNPQNK